MPGDFIGLAAEDFVAGEPAAGRLAEYVTASLSDEEYTRLGTIRARGETPVPADSRAPAEDGAAVWITVEEAGVRASLNIVSDPHAGVFIDWLDQASSLRALERLEEFELLVMDRQPENIAERYSGGRPAWSRPSRLSERTRLRTEELDEENVERLVTALRTLEWRWERVGFALERVWRAERCLELGDQLPGEIASDLSNLAALRGRINHLARQAKASKAPALERASWRKPG